MNDLTLSYKTAILCAVLSNMIVENKGFIEGQTTDIQEVIFLFTASGGLLKLYSETLPTIEDAIVSAGGGRHHYKGTETELEDLLRSCPGLLRPVIEGLNSYSMYKFYSYIESQMRGFQRRKVSRSVKEQKRRFENNLGENVYLGDVLKFANKWIVPNAT